MNLFRPVIDHRTMVHDEWRILMSVTNNEAADRTLTPLNSWSMPTPQLSLTPVIVGTAGHIDHGKTSLVRQLTGINTDRLPEEVKRGISIDLGFASWATSEFQFGVIDVPGHERFIKNMVAGATGIDLALLVVAADDGVMPQTREHLEILHLLGVKTGLIVITKVDLVETAYVELVEAETRDAVSRTFLEGCRLVKVSSVTGFGFDDLRAALCDAARECSWPVPRSVFRMPIDNVFSKEGQGTIVTGTVLSGSVARDEIVELLPSGEMVRVRGVQLHREGVKQSAARRRTGINLAQLKCADLHRGQELATPGYLRPTQRLLVSVRALKKSAIDLRDRMTLALYLGTTEVDARLILKGGRLEPGAEGFAELRVARPIVAEYGQRFILRQRSPARTVGGGRILDPNLEPRMRIKELRKFAEPRLSADPAMRLSALLTHQRHANLTVLETACRIGVNPAEVGPLLETLQRENLVKNIGTGQSPHWVHAEYWSALLETARQRIRKLMSDHQPRRSIPLTLISNALRQQLGEQFWIPIQAGLIESKWLVGSGSNYGPAELQIQLSKRQLDLRHTAFARIVEAGAAPPFLKELALQLGQPAEKLEPLLQFDIEAGLLIQISGELYYSTVALDQIREKCRQFFSLNTTATVAQLRDAWNLTRRYSIPLCEWLDVRGITIREGEVRIPGPHLHSPVHRMSTGES